MAPSTLSKRLALDGLSAEQMAANEFVSTWRWAFAVICCMHMVSCASVGASVWFFAIYVMNNYERMMFFASIVSLALMGIVYALLGISAISKIKQLAFVIVSERKQQKQSKPKPKAKETSPGRKKAQKN